MDDLNEFFSKVEGSQGIVSRKYMRAFDRISSLYIVPTDMFVCPFCGSKTREYTGLLPYSNDYLVRTAGHLHCNAFFSKHRALCEKLASCSAIYDRFKRVGSLYYQRTVFPAVPSSAFLSVQLFNDFCFRQYYIVTNKRQAAPSKLILHYASPLGLTLLTKLYLDERQIEIDDMVFYIQIGDRLDNGETDVLRVLDRDGQVFVRDDGGYYSKEEYPVLDGLIYSTLTRRLEILRVSYAAEYNEYYVDRFAFKHFVEQYGMPTFYPIFERSDSKESHIQDIYFRSESVLHAMGYNVDAKHNLTDRERQTILAWAVDIGITVHEIVQLLTTHINMRISRKQYAGACAKWKRDICFVENYRVDPEKCMLINKIRSRSGTFKFNV